MSVLRTLWMRLRGLFGQDPAARLEEEMQAHAEELISDYIRQGMPASEARYAARRELGNAGIVRQQYREQNSLPALENFWQDLKYTFRTLRRNPAFTAACIATLTIGLGAMITVLCVVSLFFWRPLPYPHPESLAVLREMDPHSGSWSFSEPSLLDLQERSRSLDAVAGYRIESLPLTGTDEPEPLLSAAVTPAFFKVFGITPMAGAAFQNSQPYVVISRELWQRKWQSDPRLIGRAILLNGASFTVAGVINPPVDLFSGVQAFVPLTLSPAESRSARDVEVVARLRPDFALSQTQAELTTIAAGLAREHALTNAAWTMRAIPLADAVIGPVRRMIWMIFAAVALLWMLACANVAGLQMARNVARRHEMSTRQALGASRSRLLAQTLTESAVLAVIGGVLGMALALFAIDAIRTLAATYIPRLADLQMDSASVAIAAACIFVSTVFFGLLSARETPLQSGREFARRDRGRDTLIVVQVALASVLLLGAGLLMQSFLKLRAVDPGFAPENILTVRVSLFNRGHDSSRSLTFFQNATNELSVLPDVASVGATNVVPFSGHGTANRFRLENETTSQYRSAAWRAVSSGFFPTLGIPLRRGRFFTAADRDGSLEVIIVTESMARQLWQGQDPIGQRIRWGRSGNPKTVVGVVGDLRDLAVGQPPIPTMFRPFSQLSDSPMTLLIHTRQDPQAAIPDIRRRLHDIDSNAALEFLPLSEAMSNSILQPQASLFAVAAFAILALMTAAFGLYGLISYRVNQRQQEIGIRLALGSSAAAVRWSVQKRCLALVFWGAAIGLPLAFALSRLMASLLYETKPTQLTAYLAVLIVFSFVALAASFGPAVRASRLDPAAAIRHE